MPRYTESWPTDGTTISTGQDLTWAEVDGDSTVVSNRITPASVNDGTCAVRAEHDTASSEMYAELTYGVLTAGDASSVGGPMVRFSASANTGYCFQAIKNPTPSYDLRRWVGSSESAALASSAQDCLQGDRARLEVRTIDANTVRLDCYVNGILLITFDDTDAARIMTGTRGGARLYRNGTATIGMDDFEIGDLNEVVAADSGSYLLTGAAAQLEYDRILVAAGGSYALTGADVSLTRSNRFSGFTTHLPYAFLDGFSATGADDTFSGFTLHMPLAFFSGFTESGSAGGGGSLTYRWTRKRRR